MKFSGKAAVLLGLAAMLSGCIGVGGSSRQYVQRPTVGAELTDLKTALDRGAITPDEFDRAKSNLLESRRYHGN